ncbi:MAG: hypothetical protein M0Z52_04295 [Actinomycetota bacterium]|nr:hypothetical protein [Actinomycetota bacterium]
MAIRNSKTGFALLILVFPLQLIITQAAFVGQFGDSLITASENGDIHADGNNNLKK